MPFEVFPQNATLYPGDKQLFTARGTPPPPMWRLGDNQGLLKSDYSVEGSSASIIEGAHRLIEGVGSVEWELDAQSIPVSTNSLTWNIQLRDTTSGVWQYLVAIKATSIDVIREGSVVLATLPITPTVGMKFKVEIASGFRLFIDGVLRHERTSFASPVLYPAFYWAAYAGGAPLVVNPPEKIPAPILSGNWRLATADSFGNAMADFTVEHGSLGAGANNLEKLYSNGTVPGQYKLAATIKPGLQVWVEDAAPAGSSVSTTGGSWVWGDGSPTRFAGTARLKSPNAVGDHEYRFTSSPITLQINKDDILVCYVFLDSTNTPTAIMLQFEATDGTGLAHRAYWGANSFTQGTNGTPSRWRIGNLPATNQWVRLEVPANLVDLEGRTLNGAIFSVFGGVCSFDHAGKYPGKLQRAEAVITIPPLSILSEPTQTLQPGAKARLQTNYDDAQTPALVTWSVVSGGGSLSGNEFTAPTTPGTTVVRATSGTQAADLTISIPAIITPSFSCVAPLEQIDWDTNISSPTWSSVPSGINTSTGVITFPNTPGAKVRIQATNGTFTATRDVLVVPKFPFTDFSLPFNWDRKLSALVSMSEDRTSRITREKAAAYDSYQVKLLSRTLTDANIICAEGGFFDQQGLGKPFILEDKVRGIRKIGWFDSDIRVEARDECDIDLAFQFLEARI